MPNVVQILTGKEYSSFKSFPVFDLFIKKDLYSARMTFRSKGLFSYPPGTVICCFEALNSPFIVEETIYELQGFSEVTCVSPWELLKRRNKCASYENHYPSIFNPLGMLEIYISQINDDPDRRFTYDLVARIPRGYENYKDQFDPTISIYDDCYKAALYNQLYFDSSIQALSSNKVYITLYAVPLDNGTSIEKLGPIEPEKVKITNRLPTNPTHWFIGYTKDYGMWKQASRGPIHTWRENRPYMGNSSDWTGAHRYETAIRGDQEREWGEITEQIQADPLKSIYIDIDAVGVTIFNNIFIGRPVQASFGATLFTGYVVELMISGGDFTSYSIKIQPDRFYENGKEVTDKWI